MGPIVLQPHYVSPIWGDTRISAIRDLPYSTAENNGEAFDVSAHPGVEGHVVGGPFDGMPFGELLAQHHNQVLGDVPESETVQVVAMSAREHLSVQVHPNEKYAQDHEGDHGKVEAWYVLEAAPGATLIAGCTTNDLDALRTAAADDSIGPRFGQQVPVHEGDFVLIPSGTMHALGPGIFCVEIGSLGNTTYRLCDWGRGRELHVQKGFDVLDPSNKPQVTHLGAFAASGQQQSRRGVTTSFYTSDVVDVRESWTEALQGRYAIVTCVAGEAHVLTGGGQVRLGYSRSCVVPASTGEFQIRGNCRVLVSRRVG